MRIAIALLGIGLSMLASAVTAAPSQAPTIEASLQRPLAAPDGDISSASYASTASTSACPGLVIERIAAKHYRAQQLLPILFMDGGQGGFIHDEL